MLTSIAAGVIGGVLAFAATFGAVAALSTSGDASSSNSNQLVQYADE